MWGVRGCGGERGGEGCHSAVCCRVAAGSRLKPKVSSVTDPPLTPPIQNAQAAFAAPAFDDPRIQWDTKHQAVLAKRAADEAAAKKEVLAKAKAFLDKQAKVCVCARVRLCVCQGSSSALWCRFQAVGWGWGKGGGR